MENLVFFDKILGKSEDKGINVSEDEEHLIIDLYLILEYGLPIKKSRRKHSGKRSSQSQVYVKFREFKGERERLGLKMLKGV